jgi:hypothetical protein
MLGERPFGYDTVATIPDHPQGEGIIGAPCDREYAGRSMRLAQS